MAPDLEIRLLTMSVSSVRTPTQADRAYEALEYLYASGNLVGGSLVSEAELARLVELGRTPVREAIKRMELDRLLVPIHRRGFVVRDVTIREYMYLLEVREPLEITLFRAAAMRGGDTHRSQLGHCAEMFETARDTRDRALVMKADYEYKRVALDAAANPFMEGPLRALQALARRFWNAHTSYEKRSQAMDTITDYHIRIIAGMVANDPDAIQTNAGSLFLFLRLFAGELSAEQAQI